MKNHRFVAAGLTPGILFLLTFAVFPVVFGLGISLYRYNPASTQNVFLGLENYRRLLHDDVFWKAVRNTVFFSVTAVSLNIVITMFLAKLICDLPWKWLQTLFRTILFSPCIAPMVGTSMVWKYGIFNTDGGLLNRILAFFGMAPKNWFLTTTPLMLLIIVYTLWSDLGYNVVLFTVGIEGVPKEFDEAAQLDGAGALRRFFLIKLPLMGHTFAFVAVMTMANYFQMFAQFRVLAAKGGMNNSAMVLTNYIYKTSFQSFDMGYASAIAMGLFVIVFGVALLQNKLMRVDWSYDL